MNSVAESLQKLLGAREPREPSLGLQPSLNETPLSLHWTSSALVSSTAFVAGVRSHSKTLSNAFGTWRLPEAHGRRQQYLDI